MLNIFKKVFSSLFVFIILFSSVSIIPLSSLKAEGKWYDQSFSEWNAKVFDSSSDEIFGERYTRAQVQWIVYSIPSLMLNTATGPEIGSCLAKIQASPDVIDMTNGIDLAALLQDAGCSGGTFDNLLKALSADSSVNSNRPENKQSLVAAIFEDRPISTKTYFRDIAQNIKLVPEAKAQTGFGFTGLNPILKLWQISRNICYSLLVIVVIAMAFMIMFRMKLSPQTVITVQSALPKIIMAIILITFSYAIAGLLIDLMYVVYGLIALVLSQLYTNAGGTAGNPVIAFNLLTKGQPANLPAALDINLGVFGLFFVYFFFFVFGFWLALIGTMGAIIYAASEVLLHAILLGQIKDIIMLIILVILFIVFMFMLFKTVWALLQAYAKTLILTITAPFQILLGTIMPNMGFGSWIKSYIGNLSVFVTISTLFQVSFLFLNIGLGMIFPSFWTGISHLLFGTNPIIHPGQSFERAWPPLLGGGNGAGGLLMFGVSFMIFSIIPKSAKFVEAFMKGQAFNIESAIGEVVGTAQTLGYGGANLNSSAEQAAYNDLVKSGKTISANRQRWHDIWSGIRGASGGKIR